MHVPIINGLTFGEWLSKRRNERGLTREEFSDHLGFSLALLRKLESGERRPSGQIASLLAAYFRVPTDEHEAFIAFARSGEAYISGEATEATADGGAGASLPPWRGVYMRRTNLPAVLTPLIGRKQEEEAARTLLLQSKTRLLTLTGAAGIGKTRLALNVASGLFDRFGDGIYFVDLAPVSDPDAVLQAVAHTLGLKEEDGPYTGSLETVLFEYVRERRMLLVLDNFEHLLDAASSLVMLMQASPWLTALVTSREALRVRGERRFSVPPLDVPDLQQLPDLDVLACYPSLELFLSRAQEVAPEFALAEDNAADIAAVCVRLGGLPLAIELAASRANHLSPAQMARALGSQLKLLVGGARDLPARHRTLRAAIEWSYKLLDRDEQRLFRCMALFVGGFTSEAVEAMTRENQPAPAGATVDMLASLVDKSLVYRDRGARKSGEVRFGLAEAVREYAMEQLEEVGPDKGGEVVEMRRRHADYYLSIADLAEQHFTGPQYEGWGSRQIEWMDRLEADLDNLRAALDWYEVQAESGTRGREEGGRSAGYGPFSDLEKGLRLAGDLRRIWFGRGYIAEGLQRLKTFLSMLPMPLPAEPPVTPASYARALVVLGRLASSHDDIREARARLEESLGMFAELNDKQLTANVLLVLGGLALAQGDYRAARSYQAKCLETYRELDHRWGAGAALDDLGNIELEEGNLANAGPLLQESLTLYQAVGEHFGAASALASLGLVAYYQRDYTAAYALSEESLHLRKKIGARTKVSDSLVLLGRAAARLGDYRGARSLLREGLTLARQTRALFTVYRTLTGFALLETLQNNLERAALLFGAAAALRQDQEIRLSPSEQAEMEADVSAARTQLEEDKWNKAWAMGNSMELEAVVTSLITEEGGKVL